MVDILNIHCDCQFVFFVYLMNFIFHTTLDAMGNIRRAHYKSMKCNVSFSQGSVSTLFRRGEHIFHVCVKYSFCLQQCKIIKIKRVFPQLWSQMYCHFYMNHSKQGYLCSRIAVESCIVIVSHFLWPPYVIGQAMYIFSSCDFFLSSFFFFYSSPNLSGHRLDVYHTSTHGVALVRI